ncbi:MAG: hypothetical protein VX262_08505, partial [Acidobacteriota bacterium]|nr:hypothetical protein [Acidobacteriota bacterium]
YVGFSAMDTGEPIRLQTGRLLGFAQVAIHDVVAGLIADEPYILAGTSGSPALVLFRSDRVSRTLPPR